MTEMSRKDLEALLGYHITDTEALKVRLQVLDLERCLKITQELSHYLTQKDLTEHLVRAYFKIVSEAGGVFTLEEYLLKYLKESPIRFGENEAESKQAFQTH